VQCTQSWLPGGEVLKLIGNSIGVTGYARRPLIEQCRFMAGLDSDINRPKLTKYTGGIGYSRHKA